MTDRPSRLPRLLLVTEAPVAPEASGASRTLHALLATYPAPLRIVTLAAAESDGLDRVVLPRRMLPERLNAIGPRTARARRALDLRLLARRRALSAAVADFRPDIVLVCPLGDWATAMAERVAAVSGTPVVTYLMDDWAAATPDPRLDALVRSSRAWMMISEQLTAVTAARAGVAAPTTMVVHNPAVAATLPRRDRAAGRPGRQRIVYAGSIWGMHLDALALTGEAVARMRAAGRDVELVIHTPPSFAERHAELFARFDIVDGGLVTPDELAERLLAADLALLACAFAPEEAAMARASVQTKLTEYMAAGTPILGVGPRGAASIDFVERWRVGRTVTEPDVGAVAAVAGSALDDARWLRGVAETARETVREHFDAGRTRSAVWDFLTAASLSPGAVAQAVGEADGLGEAGPGA